MPTAESLSSHPDAIRFRKEHLHQFCVSQDWIFLSSIERMHTKPGSPLWRPGFSRLRHNPNMCGRYAQYTSRKTFAQLAGVPLDSAMPFGETLPSWNVAPGRACALVRLKLGHHQRELVNLTWGLIPHWAKERPATRPINARIETAAEKPVFRRVFRYRRCLVAADGWYEWRLEQGAKQPYFLCFEDLRPFFFGAVWDEWQSTDGLTPTFAILTRPPTPNIVQIHDRMPVVIAPESYDAWLNKNFDDPARIAALCVPPAPNNLIAYRVSHKVSTASADGAELIIPLDGA